MAALLSNYATQASAADMSAGPDWTCAHYVHGEQLVHEACTALGAFHRVLNESSGQEFIHPTAGCAACARPNKWRPGRIAERHNRWAERLAAGTKVLVARPKRVRCKAAPRITGAKLAAVVAKLPTRDSLVAGRQAAVNAQDS